MIACKFVLLSYNFSDVKCGSPRWTETTWKTFKETWWLADHAS